jgi:FMN-dependent NADH-azoreductase
VGVTTYSQLFGRRARGRSTKNGGPVGDRIVLRVDSGVDHGASVSRKLADELVRRVVGPDDRLVERDVSLGLPFVDVPWVAAAFGDGDRAALSLSEELIAEAMSADELILVAPVYNLGIPATLKTWIDQVVRVGITFRVTPEGPEGLLPLRKAWIVTNSSGTVIGSPLDFNTNYLRTVLHIVGVTDVTIVAPRERLDPSIPVLDWVDELLAPAG